MKLKKVTLSLNKNTQSEGYFTTWTKTEGKLRSNKSARRRVFLMCEGAILRCFWCLTSKISNSTKINALRGLKNRLKSINSQNTEKLRMCEDMKNDAKITISKSNDVLGSILAILMNFSYFSMILRSKTPCFMVCENS